MGRLKEDKMKRLAIFLALAAMPAASAFGSGDSLGVSPMVALFLGAAALIVVCQTIPAMILFYSMLKGLLPAGVKRRVA